MKITVTESEAEFDIAAGWRLVTQMLAKPQAVIGLSTGQTTIGLHGVASRIFKSAPFDVSGITVFNVDELIHIPRNYQGSCYSRILDQLVAPLGISTENFVMPATVASDFQSECLAFEQDLHSRGGVDLQLLGIGLNGHIGLNQPGTPFERETWVSKLEPELEERLKKGANIADGVQLEGITRGIKNIMQSRKLILLAKGAHKAEIVARALYGPVSTALPASVVQLHPDCEILLDRAAAAMIRPQG